jgi:tetratricopeptide (TPR) repeat protein
MKANEGCGRLRKVKKIKKIGEKTHDQSKDHDLLIMIERGIQKCEMRPLPAVNQTLTFATAWLIVLAMKCLRPIFCCAVFILVAAAMCGCFPGNDNHEDEERDPHFQRGRDLVNSQEFKAAAEEFEKALESNPRSAAAHFELGCLYDNNLKDYAAAIYHYERLLVFVPDSPRANLVRERIRGCKLELAGTEFPLPNSQNLQREVNALTEENRLLKQQLDEARSHPAAGAAPVPAPAPAPAEPVRALAVAGAKPPPAAAPAPAISAPQPSTPPAGAESSHPRTYVIQHNDSIYSVAKRYGLKPGAVLAANPNVNPNRLRVGQNLNLP